MRPGFNPKVAMCDCTEQSVVGVITADRLQAQDGSQSVAIRTRKPTIHQMYDEVKTARNVSSSYSLTYLI